MAYVSAVEPCSTRNEEPLSKAFGPIITSIDAKVAFTLLPTKAPDLIIVMFFGTETDTTDELLNAYASTEDSPSGKVTDDILVDVNAFSPIVLNPVLNRTSLNADS